MLTPAAETRAPACTPLQPVTNAVVAPGARCLP